jgi:uncharacterized protein YukE
VSEGSLVAPVVSTRQAWTGSSLGEGIQDLVQAIQSEGWVDDLLAGAGVALEVVSLAIDPFSTLLANGLGWLMEHFEPLRQILDELTGVPDVVASHAATWDNMAAELASMTQDLASSLSRDVSGWAGAAAEGYQALMVNNVDALDGLSGISAGMAAATQAAGVLVQFTRDIVRDLIADLVAKVIVYAVEAVFVVTIPAVTAQVVAAVAKWTGRILSYVNALITSLTNLRTLLVG